MSITDRAVSKWETGKSMPDSSIMLELCRILDISVNELLSGEKIEMENVNQKADEALLELKRKDENNMSKNTAVFRIGTPMSVFTLIYMWVVYVLYTRFRQRKLLATGVTLFLAIPFMLLVNVTLSKMIAEPMIDIWDILFIFILLVAAFAFMFEDYAHNKGSIKY